MGQSNKPPVGFIGLGNMGRPMSRNLLKNGYPLFVWNRNMLRTEELKQMGAKVAQNPKEVANKSEFIITMLAGPPAVQEVILGTRDSPGIIEGIGAGKVLIDMTTNLPSFSTRMAETIRSRGGEMLDAPVVGSVKPATDGTLTIVVGGSKDLFEKAKPILEAMGKKIHYIGSNGAGCTMKLFLNSHLYGMLTSFVESLSLGRKAGLDTATMLKVLSDTVFKSYVSETKGPKILAGDYTPAFAVELMVKDLELTLDLARDLKMPIPITDVAKDIAYAAMTNGKEKLDYCAIATVYEQLANLKLSASH